MKEVNEIGERYFKKTKRQYRDGTYIICFESWPGKPCFDLWTHFPACPKEKCIISYRCSLIEDGMYCLVIRNRVSKFLISIEDAFRDNPLSVEKLARIGSELMPLYSQLIRAQMYDEELTAMVENPESNKPKFTWTYGEVQRLVGLIGRTWREIGVYEGINVEKFPRIERSRKLPHTNEEKGQSKSSPEKTEGLSHYQRMQLLSGEEENE